MSTQPTTIGRYQVVRQLGAGGMGAVYLARDPELDRPLAIKLVKDDLTDDAELRERFVREARSAARLRHPNIITVFDIGEVSGRPFIAMEYIPGESLADVIRRRGGLDLPRVLAWMEQLCTGLAHAHHAGIVHRDIKPGNLMVDPDGVLKIVDFGIARLGNSQLTREGMLVGTANYMAPEQLLGTGADHRADIFAVGAVFYELLTFHHAFPGTIADGLFNRICHEPPPPIEAACPGCDPGVVAIVLRALEKDPVRRCQDLATMALDIARVRANLAPAAASGIADESTATYVATPLPSFPSPRPTPPPSGASPWATPSVPSPRPTPPPSGASPRPTPRSPYDIGARPSGGPAPVTGASPQDGTEESESQRRRRVDIFLDAADMALGQGDLTKAAALIDDAARFDAASPAVASLREQVTRAQVALRESNERRQQVVGLLAQATASIGRREFAAAHDAVRQALSLDPANWEAQGLSSRILQAESAARHAALREAQETARRQSSGRLTLWLIAGTVIVAALALGIFLMSR
ncbi:MAG: protein kinase [Acidobacteria bacterium]|nr:protein kinase [Acidobacteriota bacterium]